MNNKEEGKKITKMEEDYSQWYLDVIDNADLAEHAPVRGCMVIKPYGYAIWENITKILDKMLKDIGVVNAYFPLFIPNSLLQKEAEHIEGFSPELAVVTYGGGKELTEPLVVRPTSETIIYEIYSHWIKSYRDLPLLINQWANVVRWEMRPRLFLRTSEFLWQEGHTVHATFEEAEQYALIILNNIYKEFAEKYLAMPVYAGEKSESEKFAGAYKTYCIEALMKDGKSLQLGTSHNLSDNFSKSFNIQFVDKDEKIKNPFQTSWGVSTRLIGGLIMMHSDDKGLVLPPKIAPIQIVIVPIANTKDDKAFIEAIKIKDILSQNFSVKLDDRVDLRPGEKYYEWEKKGVPIRIDIGPKDIEKKQCVLTRRDTGEKEICELNNIEEYTKKLLDKIQYNLYNLALERREKTNTKADTWEEFKTKIQNGGYVFAHFCGDKECEKKMKDEIKVVSRCLPFEAEAEDGEHYCIHCGKKSPTNKRWVFAKSY